jgi:hypothetical protein
LIMLLYAGWIPQRPLFAWGFPCLPAGVDVHRPRRFPLGLPTVGLTAGPVHIEFVDAPSLIFYLFGRQTTIVVWLCSVTAMVACLPRWRHASRPLPRLRGAEGGGGPPAVAGGRIRLQAGLDA